MNTFLTALGFVILIMMSSVLWVLIWEAIDNRKKKNGSDLGDN